MIIVLIYCSLLLIAILALIQCNLQIYFLNFKLHKHPKLENRLQDVLNILISKEDITIFHKTYDELNIDVKHNEEKAVGRYINVLNDDFRIKWN